LFSVLLKFLEYKARFPEQAAAVSSVSGIYRNALFFTLALPDSVDR
jgi:hypothetical protein